MGNCLVSKLKGVVDNNNLDFFGMLTIKADNNVTYIVLTSNVSVVGKVENGHITDSTGSENYGTEIQLTASVMKDFYVTANSVVKVPKYGLTLIFANVNIDSLTYSPVNWITGKCWGNINSLDASYISRVDLAGSLDVFGDFTNFVKSAEDTLTEFNTRGTKLTGNMEHCHFTNGCSVDELGENINGWDLSLSENIFYIQGNQYGPQFHWSLQNNNSDYIMAMNLIKFASSKDIDNMLICQASINAISPKATQPWHRAISIYGAERTSASDEAVATLKASGVSISINNILQ